MAKFVAVGPSESDKSLGVEVFVRDVALENALMKATSFYFTENAITLTYAIKEKFRGFLTSEFQKRFVGAWKVENRGGINKMDYVESFVSLDKLHETVTKEKWKRDLINFAVKYLRYSRYKQVGYMRTKMFWGV